MKIFLISFVLIEDNYESLPYNNRRRTYYKLIYAGDWEEARAKLEDNYRQDMLYNIENCTIE